MQAAAPSIIQSDLDQDCGLEHECSYQRFQLPGEAGGRVYQCVVCRAIGFRRPRFRGLGKVVHYQCSRPGCCGVARQRLHGRGPRGAYIWACNEHAVTIVPAAPR